MADTDVMGWNVCSIDRDDRSIGVANVRTASPFDIGDIALMCKVVEGDNYTWTPKLIARDIGLFFVEGEPVHGFIRVEPWSDDLLVLTLIAVKPDWQRKGVATRLLNALDSVAESFGVRAVINCGPKTEAVFKLYESLGWEDIGRTPQGYVILQKEVKK